jgi:hypothetical protein
MNAKSIGTLGLLAFVAVSMGYLLISELKTIDAGDPTGVVQESPENSGTDPTTPKVNPPATRANDPAPGDGAAEPAQPTHKVIAYYFHNTQRCMTCNKIERLAQETLREQFSRPMQEGELEWRVVNMEQPPNTHFVQDYQLVASSLVLVDLHDGTQREWINMQRVWQYVHDDEARFKEYVAEQVREYLES